uniref:Allergen Cul o1 n=1 Tax=Culicoides obsoletus TaxID=289301 RepID=K9P0U1_CULOB|nr:allergen Cul o1 [Culicoides obsoletus]
MRFATIFLLSASIILLSTGEALAKKKKKIDKSMPPECLPLPPKKRASECTNQSGFKYYPKTNQCGPVRNQLCQGHGGFTTLDECVYKCYDYRKMSTTKNVDGCNKSIKEEEMTEAIRVVSRGDSPDLIKDNRCREPNELSLKNGSARVKPAYKFNKDTNECVAMMDKVCLGRNRFKTKEECVHVCNWNLSSGRHRHIVRESNAKQ